MPRSITTATTYDHRRLQGLLHDLEVRGIDRGSFEQLSHDGAGMFSFWGTVNVGLPVDTVTVARLEVFLAKLRGGLVNAVAVKETLDEIPSCEHPIKLVAR